MAGYALLLKWTPKGISTVKELPTRIKRNKEAVEKMGIKVVGVWMTMGPYDSLVIIDAPNEQAAATFALGLAGQGNATTTTMRAFSEDELAQVVGKLP